MVQIRRSAYLILVPCIVVLLVLLAATPVSPSTQAAPPSPEQVVQEAWRRAQEAGAYDFSCDLVQTTYPAPAMANVGRGGEQSTLHMEGQTDLPARTLELRLWPSGSPDLGPGNAIEVRVAGDQAYGRAAGGEWQRVDDFSGSFAPAGDLLAYLAGGKEYRELGAETRPLPGGGQVSFTRYTFALDGPALAAYIRDQLERTLHERGELPTGLTLDVSREYNGLTGTGEVWIDSAGLPLRLILHAVYPRQADGEQVEADLQTDLRFPQAATVSATRAENELGRSAAAASAGTPYDWPYLVFQASLAVGTAALVVLLVCSRRRRWAQVVFVLLLLFCLVGVPVMQAERTGAYLEEQATHQALREENAKQAQAQEANARSQAASDWNPQLDAATQLEARQAATRVPAGNSPATGAQANTVSWRAALEEDVPDPNGDTDGDGLTNLQESRLGTNPENVDTDGDGLRDELEVRGFGLNGQHWYSNPINADTNNDGLLDTQECWTTLPATLPSSQPCNRDGNGAIPDLFDRDNDGDGVDDRVDLSPFGKASFTKDSLGATTFQLQVNGIHHNAQGGTAPVLVDLQLRPVNPQHLTYALNVLDWPSGDMDGQVQRVLDDTFATSPLVGMTVEDIAADPSSNNGDLRLVPMVEIMVPYKAGHTRNLPVQATWNGTITATTPLELWLDTAKLDSYGITARYADDRGTLAVYLPVHMIYDELGASRVAFGARMVYWPDDPDDWGNAQQVRLVWVVQMLSDSCTGIPDTPEGEDRATWMQTYCAMDEYRQETLQILNVYPEEWVLTGFAVREDQGMDVGIAFEDPGHDADLEVDNNLWAMAYGLDETFIAARDDDQDGVRDVTVGEIHRRFDNQGNGGTTEEERWGIPIDAMRVLSYTLSNQDLIAAIPMTYTRQILENYFMSGAQPLADHPSLLFVREERARTVSLDMSGQAIQRSSTGLTVDLSAVSLDTLAAMNWRPYRYQDGAWEPYPLDEYWDQLSLHLEEVFPPDPSDPDGQMVAQGKIIVAQAYYMTMVQGTAVIVQGNSTIYTNQGAAISDHNLAEDIVAAHGQGALPLVSTILQSISRLIFAILTYNSHMQQVQGISDVAKGIVTALYIRSFWPARDAWTGLTGYEQAGIGLTILKGVLSVGRLVAGNLTDANLQAFDAVINALTIVQKVVDLANTIHHIRAVTQGVSGLLNQMTSVSNSISRGTVIAGVVGTIIAGVLTVGAFIAEIVMSHTRFASMEFNLAFAHMVATIIVSVLLLIISFIPIVGQIIAAIIGIIDAVVAFICGLLPEDVQQGEAATWACKGISGLLVEAWAQTIYQSTPMVDMQDENRLLLSAPIPQLGQPQAGISAGNTFAIAMRVTSTIDYISANDRGNTYGGNVPAWLYSWQYDEKTLKSSIFEYGLAPFTQTFDLHDRRGLMAWDWISVNGDDNEPYYYVWDVATDGSNVPFGEAGINVTASLYLAESFAVPAQECWGTGASPPFIGVCYRRTLEGTNNMNLGQHMVWDVFPASLDEFYELAPKEGGYALAWAQGGDLTLPRLKDADGDGLRGVADGGADPDDSQWDTDADGLSDYYEVQKGLDPRAYDMDHDGLSDREELLRGTDPRRPDGDGDGLMDAEELSGWDFAYGTATDGTLLLTHVTSDPSTTDADLDTLSDFRERLFNFNPRVPSDPNVLSLSSELEEEVSGIYTPTDGYVLPGESLRYSATVENKLLLNYAQGLLSTSFPPFTISGQIAPATFILPPASDKTLTGDLGLLAGASSGSVELAQVAGAAITDPYAAVLYNPDLLLHLEDPSTATVFLDDSGSYPPNNGRCSEPACPQRQIEGYIGRGVRFDGTDDLLQANTRVGFSTALWFKTTQPYAGIAWYQGSRTAIMLQNGAVCGQFEAEQMREWGPIAVDYPTCSPGSYNDGRWHYVVYSWNEFSQQLYVDGQLRATTNQFASPAQRLRPSTVLDLGWVYDDYDQLPRFSGSVDDVAVYDHFLTAEEVRALFARPVLLLHLDEAALVRQGDQALFTDSSTFGSTGRCTAAGTNRIDCPTPGQSSYARRSAMFYGDDRIVTDASNALQLPGHYSQAFWVKPMDRPGRPGSDTFRQGILGNSLDNKAYPYVLREGTSLVVGFGTGTERIEHTFSNVLSIGTWSYVVVIYETFDENNDGTDDHGRFSLYINGSLRGEQVIDRPLVPATDYKRLYVGAVTSCGTLYYKGLYSLQDTNEPYSDEFEVEYQEPSGAVGWSVYHGDVDKDEFFSADQSANYCTGSGPAKIQLWEDDGDGHGGDEDMGSFTVDHTFLSWEDTGQSRAAAMGWVMQFTGYGGWIALKTRNVNPSIPFYGGLDEVAIYNRALSSYDVAELFRSQARGIYLTMDDAPGSHQLANATGREPATCPSNLATCPTMGVAGRIGQAGLFQSAESDHLSTQFKVEQSSGSTSGATLMAWVYPTSATSGRHQVISSDNNGYDWSLLREGTVWYLFNGSGSVSTGASVDLNRWQHLAAVFDPANGRVQFYKNGVQVGGNLPIAYDSSVGNLAIGAHTSQGQYFDGRIDEVQVYNQPLTAAAVQAAYNEAPQLVLHLDEELASTAFTDDSGNGYDGTCSQIPSCSTITFTQFVCNAQHDGWGEDPDGEFYFKVDGRQVWYGDDLYAGQNRPINRSATVCPGSGLQMWEDDRWSTDDDLGQFAVTVAPGNYSHQFAANGDIVTLFWQVGSGQFSVGSCPTAGTKGQVGLSPEFRGDDALQTTLSVDESSTSPGLTLMAWVLPASAGAGRHQVISSDNGGFDWSLLREGGNWSVYTGAGSRSTGAPVQVGYWQHVTAVFDPTNNQTRFYLNGALVTDTLDLNLDSSTAGIALGFNPGSGNQYWDGRIDEVQVYRRPLSTDEVAAIYRYQGQWVEERQTQQIVVDDDFPTSVLVSDEPYRANHDVYLQIATQDPTSPVRGAELQVNGGAWVPAPACMDIVSGAAYCPLFDPPALGGEGVYTLQTRAVDSVGHVETPTQTYTLYVDGTAPTVSTDIPDGTFLAPQPDPIEPDTWIVPLHGTVADPPVGAVPGSGVQEVWVTLLDSGGVAIQGGRQRATLQSGNWALDYPLKGAAPTGAYTMRVEATDLVGNAGNTDLITLLFDTAASRAYANSPVQGGALVILLLDEPTGAAFFADASGNGNGAACIGSACPQAGQAGRFDQAAQFDGVDDLLSLGGALDFAPGDYTLAAWFQSSAGTEQTILGATGATGQLRLYLQPDGRPAFMHNPQSPGSTLVSARAYNDGSWHHIAALKQGNELRLYVDGRIVAAGNTAGSFAEALNVTVGHQAGLTGDYFDGMVDEVRIYPFALSTGAVRGLVLYGPQRGHLSGTVSEFAANPYALLELRLDESADATSFVDSSDYANDGACSGGTCPTSVAGQFGGAFQFDGVDDRVEVLDNSTLNALDGDLTVMAWVRPDALGGVQRIVADARTGSANGFGFGPSGSGLRFTIWGVRDYNTADAALTAASWQHVAAVLHNGNVTFYLDGAARETITGTAALNANPDDLLLVGMTTQIGNAQPAEAFAGAIDEVRLFDRALGSDDIRLYAQRRVAGVNGLDLAFTPNSPGSTFYNETLPPGTVLYLPLDAGAGAPGGDEAQFADLSANALLATCSGNSCPSAGVTGHSGQALLFDGQDDWLGLPDHPALNVATDLTLAAWVRRSVSGSWDVIYDSGSGTNDWWLTISPYGWLYFEIGTTARYRSTVAIRDTSWHHVAVVKSGNSGTNLFMYLDAAPAGSFTAGTLATPSGLKRVGYTGREPADFTFSGLIDELTLLNRALTADEVRALYLGGQPVLQLTMEQAWVDAGASLADASGWEQPVLLHGAPGQHITAGQVGSGALLLNGTSDYATVERRPDFVRGDYALAAWFRTDAAAWQTILAVTDPNTDQPGILLEVLADGRVHYLHRYPTGGSGGTEINSPASYNDGLWHLAVAAKQGSQMVLYVDGTPVGSATDATAFTQALNVTAGRLGRTTAQRYLDGALDDVRLYPRALNAFEVRALYDSGWRPVTLDAGGADVPRSTWAYTVPAGLEGSYGVDLRGWDYFGNHTASLAERGVWNGALDTLAPRLSLDQTIYRAGSTYAVQYSYSVQDFNLTEAGFHSPCSPEPEHTYFTAPWYRALAGGDNTRLYALSGSCQMNTVDRVGKLTGAGVLNDVDVQGGLAFLIGYNSGGFLRVVNVATPWNPKQVGRDTPMPNGSVTLSAAGQYLYVGENEMGTMGVIDVSNPKNPRQVGVYQAPGSMLVGLSAQDNYVYVADNEWGLRVVDVSDPSAPAEVGYYTATAQAQGVYVAGNLAYVANGLTGLAILNVADPANPQLVGAREIPGWATSVSVSGTVAYVAGGDAGLRVVDVSDPANPTEIGSYDTPTWATDVRVVGRYAYVSDGDSGVWVLNVANPANPRLVGGYDTPGWATGIVATGAYAYVADGSGGLQVLVNRLDGDELGACDLLGNCARMQPPARALLAPAAEVPITGTLIVEPISGTYLTSTATMTTSGGAFSPSFLRALTVTVDGAAIYTQTWAGPTVSDTAWLAPWTPAGEGPHVVVAWLLDWAGNLYGSAITVTLDTQPPAIEAATLVTSTGATAGQILLNGTVLDNLGVGSVAVSIDGGEWWPASLAGDRWTAPWVPDSATPLDGALYPLTARATDLAGWTTLLTTTLLVDVAGPIPVTMTLAYQDQGGVTHPITRSGATIYDLTPTLALSWTAASDGSGLSGYRAGWTAVDLGGVTETLTPYAPGDPRRNTYAPGEAQKLFANVYSLDAYSNTTWQRFGPIYVDSPLTPDYAGLLDPDGVYRGWMDSGCTLLGVDRKVNRAAGSRPSLSAEQRFYATWDEAALRLTWSGADWSNDGDLFVYLDTAPGGITVTLNPYTATVTSTVIYLPGNTPGFTGTTPMAADYLLWVQDAAQAALWHWDGSAWVTVTALTETAYLFTPGQTDLYVPFSLLGIADPSTASLDLVALASEEDGLQLWAAMPAANPVNSPRVVRGAESTNATTFALTQRYHWDSLGPGLCPNGSLGTGVAPALDADLDLALTVEPAGTTYAFLGDHLFALWDLLFGGKPADVSFFFAGRSTDHPLLADLQEVTYTLRYENRGTAPATGVVAQVRSSYALVLPDGTPLPPPEHGYSQLVPIGTIAPGTSGSITFRGQVDLTGAQGAYQACLPLYPNTPEVCELYLRWAAASVEIVDDAHPAGAPLEWLWADHQVDYQPPLFYGVQQPEYLLAAITNTLSGYGFEDSGLPSISIEVQGPSGGTTLSCPDDTPSDGAWSCALDATAANGGVTPRDGDLFQLRLQATDGAGQVGPWTDWQPFVVDTVAPTVTALPTTTGELTGTVGVLWYRFQGQLYDNRGAAGVEVCLAGDCHAANVSLEPAAAHSYEDWPDPPLPIDAGAACGSGAIVRTFSVTDTFLVGTVQLGLNAEHPDRDQLRAELTSPSGTTVRVLGDDLLAGTRFQGLDVLLYDDAGEGLHAFQGDDDPLGPFFDRQAQPQAPLYAFRGEGAAGTWTLTVCDTEPARDDGLYHLSRLVLTPLDTAPRSGPWWYTQAFSETADGVAQTVSIYGLDLVGNRSEPPLTFSFILDNVPPVLTVTGALARLNYAQAFTPTPVLTGTVYDGGGVDLLYTIVQDPEGRLTRERVARVGGDWFFPLKPALVGQYLIWVTAEDRAGNGTRVGPFTLDVLPPTTVCLPVVLKRPPVPPAEQFQIYLPLLLKGWRSVVPEEPIAGLSASSSSPTVLGQSTALAATVVAGANVAYTWAFGDGTGGSGDIVTHTYATTGTYTVVVTASNSISLLTATTSVRVVPAEEPITGLSVTSSSPTTLGDATTFTITIAAGTNVTYDQDFGDGSKNFTLTRSPAGARVVYHLYGAPGVYTAVFTASNSVSVVTATTTVTVTEATAAILADNP